jgi:hypothetical protein
MKLAIIQAQTGVLSDNNQNKPNFNTVIPSQKEMGRVGFEPTTSAQPSLVTMTCLIEAAAASLCA